MKKLVCLLAISFLLAWQGVGQAATSVDSLIQKLVEKGILTDKEATQLKGQIASDESNTIETGAKKQLPDWLSSIKFSGDFRLRDQLQVRKTKLAAGADNFRVLDNIFNFLDSAFYKTLFFPGLGVIGILAQIAVRRRFPYALNNFLAFVVN